MSTQLMARPPWWRFLRRLVPARARIGLLKMRLALTTPPVGGIDFGDLARLEPLSPHFGSLRGKVIDRYYIETFLQRHAADIHGHVLEAATAVYARRYGHDLLQVDEMALHAGPGVTFAGDIGVDGLLPSDTFDCIVLTQTLQYALDPMVAMAQVYRALKPGGVLLLTVPGLSPINLDDDGWYWNFTPKAARKLLDETFGGDGYSLASHGNVFAATCYLQGVAQEDIALADLDPVDPCYPVVITARAVKPVQ